MHPDSRGQLPDIAVPTLITVGDQDGTTPPDLAREMTRELVAWLTAD